MYGPIQFNIIAFDRDDDIASGLIGELNNVRVTGVIRLIDFLLVTKTRDGKLVEYQSTDLSKEEREEWGGVVGGLIGFGYGGEEGMEEGVKIGQVMTSKNDFGLLAEDLKVVLEEDLKPGMSAMVVLFEHAWAVPLKQAIVDMGGVPLAQGLISPIDLIKVGAALADAVRAEEEIEAQDKLEKNSKKVKGTKNV